VVRLGGLLIQLEFEFDVTTDIVVVRVWLEQLVAINCFAIQISNHSCSQQQTRIFFFVDNSSSKLKIKLFIRLYKCNKHNYIIYSYKFI